jgi:hypothetical protein
MIKKMIIKMSKEKKRKLKLEHSNQVEFCKGCNTHDIIDSYDNDIKKLKKENSELKKNIENI